MTKLEEALRVMEPHVDDSFFAGPATEAQIEQSELALQVRFPPSYREFLLRYGAGSFRGRDINGVVADPSAFGSPNVVFTTSSARSAGVPDAYVILVEFDDSSAVALDLARAGDDGEAPVVRLWPGEPEEDLVAGDVAEDFGDFLLQFVRERTELD